MEHITIFRFMRFIYNKTNYRVLHVTPDTVTIINMDTPNRLDITMLGNKELYNMIRSGESTIVEEAEDDTIVDVDNLPERVKIKYLRNKLIIDAVNAEYAPDYIGMIQKRGKPVIKELLKRSNVTLATLWAIIIRYLQSGCKETGLLRKHRTYCKGTTTSQKRGRKSDIAERNGKNLTDADRRNMDEFMLEYLSNKYRTKKNAYYDLISKYYTNTYYDGNQTVYDELPQSERPTLDQFIYHIATNSTREERVQAKLGKRESRNQKRLLTGTALNGVTGPASIVEMDACELDISVVSATDITLPVGSPVVYFMVDIYSRLILAASLSFDNNSILAMTNCLASLVEDKEAVLKSAGLTIAPYKSGITLQDALPSCILPKIIRFDHGSDFISKESQRIAQQLHIELQYAPPGTGSLKGIVERSFREFQANFKDLTYKAGTKENSGISDHNKTATLTIEDVKKLMYSFILKHNTTQHESQYLLTKDMVKNRVGHIPAEVWRYGITHAENPTYITDTKQFLFSLLVPVSAKLCRSGIHYNKLRFIPNLNEDRNIRNAMVNTGNGSAPFQIYIDLRCAGQIYYLDDKGTLRTAKLVDDLNHRDFATMTWPAFNAFRREERRLIAEKNVESEKTRRALRRNDQNVVHDAKARKKNTVNNCKNMKENREAERSRVAKELSFENRFALTEKPPVEEPVTHTPEVNIESMTETELEQYRREQLAILAEEMED